MEEVFESIYSNNGKLATVIKTNRMESVQRIRKTLTTIELELMENQPMESLISHYAQIAILELKNYFEGQ